MYDAFGRTTTAPATTVTGGTGLTVGYYANDLVASQTQGTTTQSWTLDQGQQRLRTATTVVNGTTTKTVTSHYDDASSDSPDWVAETADGAAWTANVTDLLGSLAVTVDATGAATYTYANLHGDIQATCAAGAGAPTVSPNVDEYGLTSAGNAVPRYGWLGAKQRSGEDLGGLLLMGVRLYNPSTGRFLTVDPIPGGSANAYDYANQDPLNTFDLDGRRGICTCGDSANGFAARWGIVGEGPGLARQSSRTASVTVRVPGAGVTQVRVRIVPSRSVRTRGQASREIARWLRSEEAAGRQVRSLPWRRDPTKYGGDGNYVGMSFNKSYTSGRLFHVIVRGSRHWGE